MPIRLIASLALLFSLPVAQAAPVIGVEWAPLSRGDLTWLEEDQSSGTLVGEHDGWLQPALRMYGGWSQGIWTTVAGLRVARITHTQWAADGGATNQSHTGALRPSVDIRRTLTTTSSPSNQLWLESGAWGVVPSARLTSATYSDAEQDDANQEAAQLRARIGGAGLRIGLGASVDVGKGLSLGARTGGLLFVGQQLTEGTLMTSVAVWSETTLLAEMRL